MRQALTTIAMITVLLLVTTSCASGSNNSVTPTTTPDMTISLLEGHTAQTNLWGYWDITFDPDTDEFIIDLNRSTMATVNVVKYLNPQTASLEFDYHPGNPYVDVDITIIHPLNASKHDGYDVRGVFIGDGLAQLQYNTDLVYPVRGQDQYVLNADGYTRWFNPTEFPNPGIYGYTEGKYASSGYVATATLNPYKYYSEGLGASDDLWQYLNSGNDQTGYFLHGTHNTRNYKIEFPDGNYKFSYAVIASWGGEASQFHPTHSPGSINVDIDIAGDVYYTDPDNNGGTLVLDVNVFDWFSEISDGFMQDYRVIVESTILSSPFIFSDSHMIPTYESDYVHTFHAEIEADNVNGVNNNELWIIVEYPLYDYSNPVNPIQESLREVYRLLLDISNEIEPSWVNVTIPNGGEDFEPEFYQSILWTSEHYNGTVRIEYSNENGLHQIVDSTNNDGEFEWLVPVDISDNVLILITLLENENINDMSDDYFSISEAGWFIDISDPYPDIADCALNNFEEPILIAHNWTFFEDLIFFKEYSVKGQEKFSWNVVEDSSWDPLTPFSLSLSAGEGSGFFYVAYQGIDQIGCTLSKYTVTGQLLWSKTWGELMGPVNVMYAGNNVCLVGSWRGEVDFDPDVDSVDYRSSVDNSIDSCLIFISSNGDYIDTKTWGGESSDYALSLISMADGVIYVAGEFSSLNADFDPGINEDIRSTNGLSDVYLIQFEDQGSFSWVNTWGSAFSDKLTDLIYATEVGVVCTGAVADIADFDPGPDTDNKGQINSSSSFVSVFDENGVYSWSHVWFIDLALCVENYEQWIYLSGEYFAGIDFDPTGGVDVPSGDGGSFLTRLNSQGNYDWTCVYDSPTTIDLESDTGGHMYMLSLSSLGKVSSDGSW